jgi:hypothetical protein
MRSRRTTEPLARAARKRTESAARWLGLRITSVCMSNPHVLICLFAIGCAGSTTKFEQTWLGPSADLAAVRTVVTLYDSQDGALRRTVEDKLAHKLTRQGVRAVPAYMVLGSQQLTNRDAAKATLAASGFDGVVAIRLIGSDTYPSDVTASAWSTGWPSTYEDYVFESPIILVETTLYATDGDVLWSGRSKSVDAHSTNDVIEEVTSLVAATLHRQGVATMTARR